MAEQKQFRRGSTTDHLSFTGASGEMTIDTSKKLPVVHDGETPGGFPGDVIKPESATDGGTDAYASEATTNAPNAGSIITRDFQSANTSSTPTLDGVAIKNRDGADLASGVLNRSHRLLFDGANYRLLDPVNQLSDRIKIDGGVPLLVEA